MTIASERVMTYLTSRTDRAICANCLAVELGLPRNTAYDVARKLEGRRDFRREYGACAVCGEERMVLRAIISR